MEIVIAMADNVNKVNLGFNEAASTTKNVESDSNLALPMMYYWTLARATFIRMTSKKPIEKTK